MAFANGNTVLPILPAGGLVAHGNEYPVFGVVSDDSGPVVVQWRNGLSSSVATSTTLDRILDAVAPQFKIGDWVRPIAGLLPGNVAQRYEGPVVAVHERDLAGQGQSGPTNVVVRDRTGQYYETLQANVELIPPR